MRLEKEATMRRYTVLLYPEPEEGGYSVVVPSLPGCFTQGDTIDEAALKALIGAAVALNASRAHR